jgi:hypothetical protein
MTTKEQERKALAQIKKIVESLGEDSYIGTAFEGCFEDAETNYEYSTVNKMPQNVAIWKNMLEIWLTLPQIGTIIKLQSRKTRQSSPKRGGGGTYDERDCLAGVQ